LIELVGTETRKLLDRVYPDEGTAWQPDTDAVPVVSARESGVIVAIDYAGLVEEARRADCVLELVPALGELVPAGAPLFRVHGPSVALEQDQLFKALILKLESTLDEDVAYGLRLLVDIAERSLSESPFQDPTTAVQAIDRIHDVLRQLVRRPRHDGCYRDATGEVRLIVPTMIWEDYVRLALDEIRMAGAGSPPIARRLRTALTDLRLIAPRSGSKSSTSSWTC
jgi:uncharacterized membrane protein